MDKYYARICWNSKGWVFPYGGKTEQRDTYVAKAGFGNEEWLFNFAWMLEGYHYGFLQPVNSSWKKVTGQSLDLLLYTITPNRDRVYVAEVNNCEVLNEEQANAALRHYKRAGWLKAMEEDVSAVEGDVSRLDVRALYIFNVRFRQSDVTFIHRLASKRDFIAKLNRYTLSAADDRVGVSQWRRGRVGTSSLPTVEKVTRSAQQSVEYDPMHPRLQGELMKLLQAQFGKENVFRESDFVDLSVTHRNKRILVEIKSDPQARVAIRKALGQILEYRYFEPNAFDEDTELVIVAPAEISDEVSAYVSLLRTKFGLPIRYCAFSLGNNLPALFNEILN